MRRFVTLCALTAGLAATLPAAGFDTLVREFSRQTGAQRTSIPFFGLARFVVGVTKPAGVGDLHLALFENASIDVQAFASRADQIVGQGWKRMVRTRSRNKECTSIYVKPEGAHLRVLIATLDGGDATFLEVRLQPDGLMNFVDSQRRHHTID